MRTIVIGAGPAGLNAAIFASGEHNRVIVLEKNEKAGKKLFLTGKGRGNVSNACDEREFIANIASNPHFLHSAIAFYSHEDTQRFFSLSGVPLVEERGHRLFPESGHAYDLTDALVRACAKKKVAIHLKEEVVSIAYHAPLFTVFTTRGSYEAESLVIATGGLAYPSTGSTGDGYAFAKSLGHSLVPCVPGLVGIKIKERIPEELRNFSLRNVTLRVKEGKAKHEEFGEIAFREDYLDGPIALTISSLINRKGIPSLSAELDLKPGLDEAKLDQRLQRDVAKRGKGTMRDLLQGLFPWEFLGFFFAVSGFDPEAKLAVLSKENRGKLISFIKHFPLHLTGLNPFERAIITCGGISTKEVDSKTMESKRIPGLYFAGEVLDVDAFTGGFNLQTALSTGALAGASIASIAEEE